MTPLERAARALAMRYYCGRNGQPPDDPWNVQAVEIAWKAYVKEARAVLQAIREPSAEMIDIGAVCSSSVPIPTTAKRIWEAMIDQALAETPK